MNQKIGLTENPVVIFDGICSLCNRIVKFIVRKDRKKIFRFTSLQSDFGKQLLSCSAQSGTPANSIILIYKGKIYIRSRAVIQISKLLGGIFSMAFILQIIPRYLSDAFYDLIARNRYQWFGKQDSCMMPDSGTEDRFLI